MRLTTDSVVRDDALPGEVEVPVEVLPRHSICKADFKHSLTAARVPFPVEDDALLAAVRVRLQGKAEDAYRVVGQMVRAVQAGLRLPYPHPLAQQGMVEHPFFPRGTEGRNGGGHRASSPEWSVEGRVSSEA